MELHPFPHLSICLAVHRGCADLQQLKKLPLFPILCQFQRTEGLSTGSKKGITKSSFIPWADESFCSTLPGFFSSDSHLSFEVFR